MKRIGIRAPLLRTLMILSILAGILIMPTSTWAQSATPEEWKTIPVRVVTSPVGTQDATIKYKISSGEIGFFRYDDGKLVKDQEIWVDPYFQSLSINILSNSSGTMVLELPRSVIDSKMADNATDAPFTAFFQDGNGIQPADTRELNKTADVRVVSIDFPVLKDVSTYNVGIKGSYAMPEFDMAIPVLSLSLASLLIVALKFRKIGSSIQPEL